MPDARATVRKPPKRWHAIPISSLRVGQRFRQIPETWYGEGKILEKIRRDEWIDGFVGPRIVYDIIYDAAVVNPPARQYGVPVTTKVLVLRRSR